MVLSTPSLYTLQYYRNSEKEEQAISNPIYRANKQIRASEVRLIGAEGENHGVISTQDAQLIADEASLDLVEVAPNADPPVCRVMDLGKFIYQRKKKEREARRAQTKVEVKEMRLRPKTSEGHIQFKVDDARRWLKKGNKVKVRIQFRGREMHYPEIAMEALKDVAERLQDVSIVEYQPSREGRSMLMVLAPDKGDK